ncbi:MAG: CDP-glucose 4,6-dehydratase [Cyanobacteriota bacterium]|nr:CDP-glucose 4,6-dehydratase [Cyanobacteriota bacterium]
MAQRPGPLEAMVNGPTPHWWTGRRVLLTGHTGFKGSWLALWLLQLGAQVHGLGLDPDPEAPSLYTALDLPGQAGQMAGGLHDHRLDLRDAAAVANRVAEVQPEVVLHLAAQPLVRRAYREPLLTWQTNLLGSLHLLEALRLLPQQCAVVMVTTDKVYANREWAWGYRECDRLGGHDPYSASKAAAELAIASWRSSYCGSHPHQHPGLAIATARAGNVIGGGDWASDRIVPDAMRACATGTCLPVRCPTSTRPWQHVLDPLAGYLALAEALAQEPERHAEAWNFGPLADAHQPVARLVNELHRHWPGQWCDASDGTAPHEAGLLHLVIDKAVQQLGWQPRWDFATSVARTAHWYRQVREGAEPLACCLADLEAYHQATPAR